MRWLERFLLFLLSFVVFPSCLSSCFLSFFHLAFPLAFCFLSILHFLLPFVFFLSYISSCLFSFHLAFCLFSSCLSGCFCLISIQLFAFCFLSILHFLLLFVLVPSWFPRNWLSLIYVYIIEVFIPREFLNMMDLTKIIIQIENNNTQRKLALLMCYCNHFSSLKLFCLL